jgi:flagellar biosynthesis/type III secretory pathway protein FliH
MAMIRQASAVAMARDAVVLDLGDLKRQADHIRARARSEAELIVARARAQREQILAGAAEEGRAAGYASGLEEGRAVGLAAGRAAAIDETKSVLAALDQAWSTSLQEFLDARDTLLAEARHDVLRLAVRMGERITRRVLALNPAIVAEQLAAVLAILLRPTRLVVTVNPDDLPLLRESLPSLAARFESASHVELVPDARLARGSCIARCAANGRSGAGEIDASIDVQLQRIIETLLPGRPPAAPGSEGEPDDDRAAGALQ